MPLRIGLAGAGFVAPHHLKAWQRLHGRATVVAVADPKIEAARARARAFGVPAVYASVEEMLERERLDALDVASPRETHAHNCRLAADRGLAILCQKPLAPTLAEAEALVAEIGNRARLMVHENWRFRPHYRRIAGWLREGRIGGINSASMQALTSGLIVDASGRAPAIERQPMFATLERLLVMEVLIHHVDTLRFLLGPLALKRADIGRRCRLVRGEDQAIMVMATAKGREVTLIGDFTERRRPPVLFDYLQLLGTEGSIVFSGEIVRIIAGTRDEVVPVDLAADYDASYLGALTHFLDRLDDGGSFETSPEDNLETLRIVEQVYSGQLTTNN